jgi:uronate dehydrogenase
MATNRALRIGVLGGSGRVGAAMRRHMAEKVHSITVLDLNPPAEMAANETFRRVDIQDQDDLQAAFGEMDGIIHLAGIPKEAPLAEILAINVAGTNNVYEAARLAGISRIVLGSSNHAIGMYPRTTYISPEDPMRPDGLYGLSKCWGELTAGLYWDKHGIRSLIVRIGNSSVRPMLPRSLEVWLSPRDMCQLAMIGLTHPDVTATTVFGVSKGGGSWWDNSTAVQLGYQPQDVILEHADPQAFEPDRENNISQHFQGARYAAADHDGTIRGR